MISIFFLFSMHLFIKIAPRKQKAKGYTFSLNPNLHNHTYLYIFLCKQRTVKMRVPMCACVHICAYTCVYICVHICVYICGCLYTCMFVIHKINQNQDINRTFRKRCVANRQRLEAVRFPAVCEPPIWTPT